MLAEDREAAGAEIVEQWEQETIKFKWTKRLSPFNVVEKKAGRAKDRHTKQMKKVTIYEIKGVTDYDYMLLDEQFHQGKRDSNKLDEVCFEEIGENKLIHPNNCSFKEFYHDYWQEFVDYNIHDVRLLVKLEKKLSYMKQAFTFSYQCHCQFKDNFGTVVKQETALYSFLNNEGIIMQDDWDKKDRIDNTTEKTFEGAYVKDPIPGFYEWVEDFDVSSLYPSVIIMLNLSPETKLFQLAFRDNIWEADGEKKINIFDKKKEVTYEMTIDSIRKMIKDNNYHISSNNTIFENKDKKPGVIPRMLQYWYKNRKEKVKTMNEFIDKKRNLVFNGSKVEDADHKHKMTEKNKDDIKITAYVTDAELKDYHEYERQVGIYYNLQWANKILMNSLYGALSTKFFRFYDIDLSLSVTLTGQTVIKTADNFINEFYRKDIWEKNIISKNFIVKQDTEIQDVTLYNDTDSCYLSLKQVLEKLSVKDEDKVKVCQFLAQLTLKNVHLFFDKFSVERFNASNNIKFEQELIARSAIFCKSKMYTCYIINEKGVPKDKILNKGLKLIKSDTPKKCREKMKQIVEKILKGATIQDITKITKDLYNDFVKWNLNDIALPKTCNNYDKFMPDNENSLVEQSAAELNFIKGIPQHIKAAYTLNYLIKKNNIIDIEPVKERDRFFLIKLKEGPTMPFSVCAYKDYIPKELGITEKMVDKDEHFRLAYTGAMDSIFEAMKWDMPDVTENRVDIDDIFD